MTITTPSAAPIVPSISGSGIPTHFRSYSDITEFTYRTGMTHMALLESMRVWIQNVLIPHYNDNFNGLEDAWEEQVNTLLQAVQAYLDAQKTNVDAALEEQTTAYTEAIAAALQAIAEADVPITDPTILAVLNTTTSATRQWLDNHYGSKVVTPDAVKTAYTVADSVLKAALDAAYEVKGSAQKIRDDYARILSQNAVIAPAPKGEGQDDTAVLIALINRYGTVFLQEGNYRANLDITNRYIQPNILGVNRRFTTIQAWDKTKPVIKFNGGSGVVAGGSIRSLALGAHPDGGGIGLAFSGCGGVAATDVAMESNFDEALRFWNERGNDFTEFCTFEGSIYNAKRPVRYYAQNNVESFHGSGLVGNTVIGMPSTTTGPAILIDNPALPYNAPLSATVFFSAPEQWLISYANANFQRPCSFYGTLRMEGNSPNASGKATSIGRGGARVYYVGGVIWLASGDSTLGNIYLARKITYEQGTILAELCPVTFKGALKNTPTLSVPGILKAGEGAEIILTITGPNYHKSFLTAVYQSPYDGSGNVQNVRAFYSVDSNGVGDPTLTWGDSGLYVANSRYDSTFSVQACITPMGGELRGSNLAQ